MKIRFQFDTSFVYILCKLPREIRNIYANDPVNKNREFNNFEFIEFESVNLIHLLFRQVLILKMTN